MRREREGGEQGFAIVVDDRIVVALMSMYVTRGGLYVCIGSVPLQKYIAR